MYYYAKMKNGSIIYIENAMTESDVYDTILENYMSLKDIETVSIGYDVQPYDFKIGVNYVYT